ncbi:MAG: hypothetical protein QOE77_2021 [Blastocatellia bacterium]|jgi:hypothetical protein|nr:hypothetical protein [Blastocatellia bacterium]
MENHKSDRAMDIRFRWAPLFLALSLLGLIISLWIGPIYAKFLIASAVLGLFNSALSIFDVSKGRRSNSSLSILVSLIFMVGMFVIQDLYLPHDDRSWMVGVQFVSSILVLFFSLAWCFRERIFKPSPP